MEGVFPRPQDWGDESPASPHPRGIQPLAQNHLLNSNFLPAFRLQNLIICHSLHYRALHYIYYSLHKFIHYKALLTVLNKKCKSSNISVDVSSKLLNRKGRVPSVSPHAFGTQGNGVCKGAHGQGTSSGVSFSKPLGWLKPGLRYKHWSGTTKLCPFKPKTLKIYISPRSLVTLLKKIHTTCFS